MTSWYVFPKEEGNDCKRCQGTGKQQWYDLDGCTIYHWQKPNVAPCEDCKPSARRMWERTK